MKHKKVREPKGLKVGDRVKVKKGLRTGEEYGGIHLLDGMANFRGKTGIITSIHGLDPVVFGYYWSPKMLLKVRKHTMCKIDSSPDISDKFPIKKARKSKTPFVVMVLDSGTGRAITWNSSFKSGSKEYVKQVNKDVERLLKPTKSKEPRYKSAFNKGEKVIQLIKDDTYYLALTSKGRILCADVYLSGNGTEDLPEDGNAIFWSEIKQYN